MTPMIASPHGFGLDFHTINKRTRLIPCRGVQPYGAKPSGNSNQRKTTLTMNEKALCEAQGNIAEWTRKS